MSAQLTLDLASTTGGLVPVAREPISILWPTPDPAPLTADERSAMLERELRRQEDIVRWHRNREKALVDELVFLRSYIRAVAEGHEAFTHRSTRWQRTTPEQDAKGLWRWILDSAETNRAMEDSIMAPHRRPRPEPDPPPHDIREFGWDECKVYRHASGWRIGWRGGDVCAMRPHPTDSLLPGFWDILTFPSRKAAAAELDRYRADVENIRREWEALRPVSRKSQSATNRAAAGC